MWTGTARQVRRRAEREARLHRLDRQRVMLLGADERALRMGRPDLAARLAAQCEAKAAEWERLFSQQWDETNHIVAAREDAHAY